MGYGQRATGTNTNVEAAANNINAGANGFNGNPAFLNQNSTPNTNFSKDYKGMGSQSTKTPSNENQPPKAEKDNETRDFGYTKNPVSEINNSAGAEYYSKSNPGGGR